MPADLTPMDELDQSILNLCTDIGRSCRTGVRQSFLIGKRYDDPPRGGLLSTLEKLVNEPPPPPYFH